MPSTCSNCARPVPDGATLCARCGKRDHLKGLGALFVLSVGPLALGPYLWVGGNPILAIIFGAGGAFSAIFFGGMFLSILFGKVTPVGGFAPGAARALPAATGVDEDGPPPVPIVDEPVSLADLDKRLAPPPP